MASFMSYSLLAAATVLNGFLAGGNVDREIVQMPAWRKVGASAWAAYSRRADLGNGLFLYPFEAIGGALLTIAASVSFYFDRAAPHSASVPVYLGVVLVLGGLLATLKAAPIMLSLRRSGDDTAVLQRAFEGFKRWGDLRAAFQVLAFIVNLWTLVAVLRGHP